MSNRLSNLLFLGIDTLRADHMSLYGYPRLTTPHLDKLAAGGAAFENCISPHIPTTPGYSSMFTGMDCFGTDVVALRHEGGLGAHVRTLAEILGDAGYNTSCVGFSGNPASRGFQNYLDFSGWGSWRQGRSHKAENLNDVAIPELHRLAAEEAPFFLFLRHMDPHAPYLPPAPFERLFYGSNELDPANHSLEPVYAFKPFADFLSSWFPPGCTDKEYVIAQYDGAIAYMDACIGGILSSLEALKLVDDTLIVVVSDHGESLYDHECWFDHHGIYDCTLHVPLVFHLPGNVPEGKRIRQTCQQKDVSPTVLSLLGIETDIAFDGSSLAGHFREEDVSVSDGIYITEATWMRKHGWRTTEWKLIRALEPDFHYKPETELYDLVNDPVETINLAESRPEIVSDMESKMLAHIQKREAETGRTNPMYTNLNWNGHGKPFESFDEAYNTLYIGSPDQASREQARELQTQRGAEEL